MLSTRTCPPCASVMCFDQGQADPRAADVGVAYGSRAVEALEDLALFFRRNAHALIAHREQKLAPLVVVAQRDADRGGAAVLHGVIDQVQHHQGQRVFIEHRDRHLRRQADLKLTSLAL